MRTTHTNSAIKPLVKENFCLQQTIFPQSSQCLCISDAILPKYYFQQNRQMLTLTMQNKNLQGFWRER